MKWSKWKKINSAIKSLNVNLKNPLHILLITMSLFTNNGRLNSIRKRKNPNIIKIIILKKILLLLTEFLSIIRGLQSALYKNIRNNNKKAILLS